MLDEYIKELEEDLKINELNLKEYQLKLPAIKHKWAGRCIRLKLSLSDENKKLNQIKKSLAEELEKAAPVKMSNTAINQMIENHEKYKAFKQKQEEKKLLIELLEKAEKTLNSATFDIKNLVEIMKLELT